MNVQYEIEVATGERGKRLAKAQAEAIHDVLLYLASKRENTEEAPDDDEG